MTPVQWRKLSGWIFSSTLPRYLGCAQLAVKEVLPGATTLPRSRYLDIAWLAAVSAPQRYQYLGGDIHYEGKAYADAAMPGSSADKKQREREKREAVDVNSADSSSALASSPRMPDLSPAGDPSTHQAKMATHQVKMAADLSDMCEVLRSGFKDVASTIVDKLDNVSKEIGAGLEELHDSLGDKLDKAGDRAPTHDVVPTHDWSFDDLSDCYSTMPTPGGPAGPASETSGEAISFFKRMNKPPGDDTVGPLVDADLAEGTDRFFRKPISPEEFKEMKRKYPRAENMA